VLYLRLRRRICVVTTFIFPCISSVITFVPLGKSKLGLCMSVYKDIPLMESVQTMVHKNQNYCTVGYNPSSNILNKTFIKTRVLPTNSEIRVGFLALPDLGS
jgi:hypothetical protein